MRSRALGHSRGDQIINVYNKTKSARLKKDVTCDGTVGNHDSLDFCRYMNL
jgi:hypothetical protein